MQNFKSLLFVVVSLAAITESCDKKPNASDLKVTGGQEDAPGEFASVLSLEHGGYVCTASVIGISGENMLLLTAAHCGTPHDTPLQKHTVGTRLTIGTATDLGNSIGEPNAEILDVSIPQSYFNIGKGALSDFYDPKAYQNAKDEIERENLTIDEESAFDIAVIAVAIFPNSPEFQKFQQLSVMELSNSPPRTGDNLTLVGFGNNDCVAKTGSGVRRYGYNRISTIRPDGGVISVVGTDGATGDQSTKNQASNSTFDSAATCGGDSGGPVFTQSQAGLKILGVVSSGHLAADGQKVTSLANINFRQNRSLIQDALDRLGSYQPTNQGYSDPANTANSDPVNGGSCYHELDDSVSICREYSPGNGTRDLRIAHDVCQNLGDRWTEGACNTSNRSRVFCAVQTETYQNEYREYMYPASTGGDLLRSTCNRDGERLVEY
jgi:V8-like Glu-specific endopeptidase